MKAKEKTGRFFSLELHSKSNLRNISMTNRDCENVLIEGTIGNLVRADFNDGVILEVVGDAGTLRLDLKAEEISESSIQESITKRGNG